MFTARHGTENDNGLGLGEGAEKSGPGLLRAWWRVCQGRMVVGSLYKEKLRILVGKGNRTQFWKDLWIGDRPLKNRFPRLFRVARNKLAARMILTVLVYTSPRTCSSIKYKSQD